MNQIQKVLIVVPCIVFLLLTFVFVKYKMAFSKDFSSYEWKALYLDFETNEKNDQVDGMDIYSPLIERRKMVKSLVRSNLLIGKSKYEVIDLLGLEGNEINTNKWLYWIYFTPVDNGWLEGSFNEKYFVEMVSIYED